MRIVVAARTAPNRDVRFGGERSGLDERGRRDAAALAVDLSADRPQGVADRLIAGPEKSVRETADHVDRTGSRAAYEVVEQLASLDVGRWAGRTPAEVDPRELAAWFGDVDWRGHGGESVREFVRRIEVAVDALADAEPVDATLVLAGPVAQAVLCDDAVGFFACEVRPASMHRIEVVRRTFRG
nr:histidine phosphatase family protein [Gordonia shandongensis]